MRLSYWSSDVCSSDLALLGHVLQRRLAADAAGAVQQGVLDAELPQDLDVLGGVVQPLLVAEHLQRAAAALLVGDAGLLPELLQAGTAVGGDPQHARLVGAIGLQVAVRSEEHTSELQSLMRISYAVFCLTKKTKLTQH